MNVDPVFGHGYRMKKDNFVIELLFLKELTIPACNELAGKIGKKYNLYVEKNQRTERPNWAITGTAEENCWSYQFFIKSEHDESILANEDFKKMIRGY